MVMTQVRTPAHTPAKKAVSRKTGVRSKGDNRPEVIVQPGKVRSRDVAQVFQLALAKGGNEVERKLAEALKESEDALRQLKLMKLRRLQGK